MTADLMLTLEKAMQAWQPRKFRKIFRREILRETKYGLDRSRKKKPQRFFR